MRRLAIPDAWRGRAIVIADVDPHPDWFTEDELSTLATFKLAKRRAEWLASRVAAKQLALELGLCADPRDCRIERPFLLPARWYVSLSHSAPYAAAAIAREPVGIDVQTIRVVDERAAHLFLTDEETAELQRDMRPHRLLHFWCAKEAAWKRQLGVVPTLKQVPIEHVETIAFDDVIVALTRPTS